MRWHTSAIPISSAKCTHTPLKWRKKKAVWWRERERGELFGLIFAIWPLKWECHVFFFFAIWIAKECSFIIRGPWESCHAVITLACWSTEHYEESIENQCGALSFLESICSVVSYTGAKKKNVPQPLPKVRRFSAILIVSFPNVLIAQPHHVSLIHPFAGNPTDILPQVQSKAFFLFFVKCLFT